MPKHKCKGVATGTANYQGHHREGIGYVPLGDRHRHIDGNDFLEERGSIDKYSKYYEKS